MSTWKHVELRRVVALLIEVPGQPIGKGRPKFTKKGIAYTPEKTRNWEAWAKLCAKQAIVNYPACPIFNGKPLRLEVTAYFEIPASWPAWKRQAAKCGQIAMTTRPDGDNILKAVADSCQGIVFNDDCYITEKTIRKRWCAIPRTIIQIWISENQAAQTATRKA